MKLMISTNERAGAEMLAGNFKPITWASDNLKTVAHYYEGCVLEIDVSLDVKLRQEYIRYMDEMAELGLKPESYNYGMAKMRCPAGAKWYAFSSKYLAEHVKSIREIYPNLLAYDVDTSKRS